MSETEGFDKPWIDAGLIVSGEWKLTFTAKMIEAINWAAGDLCDEDPESAAFEEIACEFAEVAENKTQGTVRVTVKHTDGFAMVLNRAINNYADGETWEGLCRRTAILNEYQYCKEHISAVDLLGTVASRVEEEESRDGS